MATKYATILSAVVKIAKKTDAVRIRYKNSLRKLKLGKYFENIKSNMAPVKEETAKTNPNCVKLRLSDSFTGTV
jgi:hypothetical protein